MNKKGQAAMEFLMTYGWAILAAIIAIGVLAYYGVFSADKYAPSGSILNLPFYIQASSVSTTELKLEVKNNGGDDLNISRYTVSGLGCNTFIAGPAPYINISQGAARVLNLTCGNLPNVGKIAKGDVSITYYKSVSGPNSLNQTSTGTFAEKVA